MRDLLWQRLLASLVAPLSSDDFLLTALLMLAVGVLILPVGLHTGFLRTGQISLTLPATVGIAVIVFVFPSLSEEILFRVFLLPHPLEAVSPIAKWLWAISGTSAFVLYHPLKAPFVSKERAALFVTPVFLWMSLIVGACSATSYLVSGSLWPPVFLHWSVVLLWIFYFGGHDLLFKSQR